MKIKNIAFEMTRVTEWAAIAAYKFIGRCDKNLADKYAVEAMRIMLDKTEIDGRIVIGEGEMDDAPMLYNGEKVGSGGIEVDIAVDPIDGTLMVATGEYNSISAIAVAAKDCMLKAPDMYMNKIVVGPNCCDVIDIEDSITNNIYRVAKALNKNVSEVGVAILDRERHQDFIKEIVATGARIFLFSQGDITKAIQTCDIDSNIDIMYGIGGAPEGVLAAAAVKALGGNIQGKLVHYDTAWPNDDNTTEFVNKEIKMLDDLGLSIDDVLYVDDFICGDDFAFSCTAITKGDLLNGVMERDGVVTTHSLLVRAKTRTIRRIKSTHILKHKSKQLMHLLDVE